MTTANHESGRTIIVRATAAHDGARLDRVLAAEVEGLSRSRLQLLIREGHVRDAAGKTVSEPSARVKPGQNFAIFIPENRPARPQAQAILLDVIFEDGDLIVIDKPAGMVVHPAPGNPDRTLVNALLAHCGDSLSGIGGERRPGIVHRLDKDTSGLMIAAKNDRAHLSLTAQFHERTVDRAYIAIVWGAPRPAKGEIEGNIGRSPGNRKKMAVLKRGGRPALTRYRTLRRYGGKAGATGATGPVLATALECRLATGRTHQIRVHLAHRGHAVLGDPLYGGTRRRAPLPLLEAVRELGRQALHARLLGFSHPRTGERLQFESPLPTDIKRLTNCLESLQETVRTGPRAPIVLKPGGLEPISDKVPDDG